MLRNLNHVQGNTTGTQNDARSFLTPPRTIVIEANL
jgi:hypothetical protein